MGRWIAQAAYSRVSPQAAASVVARMQPGPIGPYPYLDNFVRLSKLPVATISEIRGRTRGTGTEFVLATDIPFASEKAILGQLDVGVGTAQAAAPCHPPRR